MKTCSLFLIFLFGALLTMAQGVRFTGAVSWHSVLDSARAQHRLIFLDVYTDWCGPCRRMDQEVFPGRELGNVLNTNFINYRINAEKGEGPLLKKRYHVTSYPTFLFIRGDGTLIYRADGARSGTDMIRLAQNAQAESRQPITLSVMDSLYPVKRKDRDFMYAYLLRRTRLGLANADLLDEYFRMLDGSGKSELKNLQLVVDNGSFLTRSLRIGPAFYALIKHREMFPRLRTTPYNPSLYAIIGEAKNFTLREAIARKKRRLVKRVLRWNTGEDLFNNDQLIRLQYDWGIRSYKAYIRVARRYVDRRLMVLSVSTLDSMDRAEYQKIMPGLDSSMAAREMSAAEKEAERSTYRRTQTIRVTKMLNGICRHFLEIPGDTAAVRYSLPWIQRCMELAGRDTAYFRYVCPVFQKTYAGYLDRNIPSLDEKK